MRDELKRSVESVESEFLIFEESELLCINGGMDSSSSVFSSIWRLETNSELMAGAGAVDAARRLYLLRID
jgi:hypothetical protein